MSKTKRGTNNSLEERIIPYEVLPGVCRYVGINKKRLRVYYFEGQGYWVAPYGYKLISKRGKDVSIRRLDTAKKRTVTLLGPTLSLPLEESLRKTLLDLNGDNPFYNARVSYCHVFDTVGYYTTHKRRIHVYHLGINGLPELSGVVYDKESLDELVRNVAIPSTQRSIDALKRSASISLEEACCIATVCPELMTQEDLS